MFVGGPVKRDAALCLAALRVGADPNGVPGLRHVAGRMVMVDLDAEPELIAPLVEGVRIFAGTPAGPLVSSKARLNATTGSCCRRCLLMFWPAESGLVGQVLRRQPLPLSLLATHPIDVSRN